MSAPFAPGRSATSSDPPLRYSVLDPTGNVTLLVETPVPEKEQPALAKKLMALEPGTEQVGFVRFGPEAVSLRMAGGEFCGNASMSAAVLYLLHGSRENARGHASFCPLSDGSTELPVTVSVNVSGTPEPVPVTLEALPDGVWQGSVGMPQPVSVQYHAFPSETISSGETAFPVVRFPGITHVILEEAISPEIAELLARSWCRELGADALGLMFLNREEGSLKPLVYVPSADTLFWESSCASGTTAVGAWLASQSAGPVELKLSQPGGTLKIRVDADGRPFLSGRVQLIKQVPAPGTDASENG